MQEVFEKIIEELEIERTIANNTFVKYEMNVDLGRVFGLEKAIEIVKQEAEKCKSIYMDGEYCWQSCWCTDRCGECNRLCNGDIDYYESYDARNSGWIPVSERLPKEPEEGLTDIDECDEYIVMIEGADIPTALNYVGDGEWYRDGNYYKVIAWMPLPEPYTKGE